jgi:hypothetical protein
LIDIVIRVALIAVYSTYRVNLTSFNHEFIKFASKNHCTDGPLHRALGLFESNFSKDISILDAGLSMTVISLFFELVILARLGPLRSVIGSKVESLAHWKENTAADHKIMNFNSKLK